MEQEILNIEYHKVRLMVKSLNLYNNCKEASYQCGVSTKCFYNYMKLYNIKKEGTQWVAQRAIKL